MMNYEIFKEVVKEKFMDYMPEKFKGVELVAEPVEKVNVTLDGIILRGHKQQWQLHKFQTMSLNLRPLNS